MNNFNKIWLISFSTIIIPILYYCFDIFILSNVDGKLGDVGTLIICTIIYLIVGFVNATVFGIIYHLNYKEKPSRKILRNTFVSNLILCIIAMPIFSIATIYTPFVFLFLAIFIGIALYSDEL